jgi:hypothetical protein
VRSKAQSLEFTRGGYRQRLRPLGDFEFFQVQEESANAQKGAQQPLYRLEIEIWIIDFMSGERAGEEMI